jgi:hypothetical protein
MYSTAVSAGHMLHYVIAVALLRHKNLDNIIYAMQKCVNTSACSTLPPHVKVSALSIAAHGTLCLQHHRSTLFVQGLKGVQTSTCAIDSHTAHVLNKHKL